MDAGNRSLEQWFTLIKTGQLQLPRFQRFEAWGYPEIGDLLQTVLHELPAGAALVLKIGDEAPFRHRILSGAPEPTESINELLLDGQQRLTALWRALRDGYDHRTFFVSIKDQDEDEDGRRDFLVSSESRWVRNESRYPMWCDSPPAVLERELIPARLLRPGSDAEVECQEWLSAATDGDAEKLIELQPVVFRLRSRVANFNLPHLDLPVGSSEAVVLNVFEKLNTRAVPLSAFDIIVARVESETGESLHDLVSSLEGTVPGLSRYVEPSKFVLQASALMQGKAPTQQQLVFLDFERMVDEWPKLVLGAEKLVEFLHGESVIDRDRLPSEVVLAPLAVLWANAPETADQLGSVRTLLRKYMWRAFVTERYESAAAGNSFQDFSALLPAVRDGQSEVDAPIFEYALPIVDEIVAAGWPKRRERLSRSVLTVSFRSGALDLADGAPISAANVSHREYHHLFPMAYLESQGIDADGASRALNCALITWRTNRTIGAQPPVDYLKARVDAAKLGETEVRHRLGTHVIDFDSLETASFDEFLEQRATQMLSIFEQLCDGGAWP